MLSSTLAKIAISLTALVSTASAAFDASSNKNVALYWGQASAGSQEDLAYYCESDAADILILSFMSSFPGTDDIPTLNFASACSDTYSSGLLKCDQIAADIQTCQGLGKKILLSMGGASGSYGFSSDSDAEDFALTLWNLFGEGSADERPFGDAVIDGFDFDIENNDDTGYAALATKLRTYFAEGTKDYYLSAAPQCVYPDASIGDALSNAEFDFAFVQFYNNYCNVEGGSFNWDTWVEYAQNTSPNKDIKLYLGLPGSTSAAGSGYIDIDTLKSTIDSIGDSTYFGGVMLWDASQGFTNTVDSVSYAELVKEALDGLSDSATSSTLTSLTSSSTSTYTTPSSTSTHTTSTSSTSTSKTSTATASVPQTKSSTANTSTESTSTSVIVVHTTTSLLFTSTVVKEPTSVISSQEATAETSNSNPKSFVVAGTTSTPSTSAVAVKPATTSTSASTSQTSTFVEVTTNTFTPAAGSSTLNTVVVSTTSTTADSSTSSTSSSGCDFLTGSEKASCLNAQYEAGQFAGSADVCTDGDVACTSSGEYAVCNWGSWAVLGCAAGTTCYASADGDSVTVSCNWPLSK